MLGISFFIPSAPFPPKARGRRGFDEELLFDRNVVVTVGAVDVTVEVESLLAIMREEYAAGHTALLDSYAEGGETQWDYNSYKTLYSYFWWDSYSYSLGGPVGASTGSEPSDPPVQNPLYPFNLGELSSLPGINQGDLTGLDVESKNFVRLSLLDPKELLTGLLNMRVLAPGSSLQTIGRAETLSAPSGQDSFAVPNGSSAFIGDLGLIYWESGFSSLSERDIRFRLIPALLLEFADGLLDSEGTIDLDALRELLE